MKSQKANAIAAEPPAEKGPEPSAKENPVKAAPNEKGETKPETSGSEQSRAGT